MMLQRLAAVVLVFASVCVAWGGGGDGEKLEGLWVPTSAQLGGKPFPDEVTKSIKLEIKGNTYKVTVGKETDGGTFKIDPKSNPKALDITSTEGPNKGKKIPAIYDLKGDTLRVCYELGGKDRPTAFKSEPESKHFLVVYKRQK